MKERVVENWLTSCGERGYEVPFAQVLAQDGHRIVQGPVHHAHEHGKDIITFDRTRKLCAFQLKGGTGKMNVSEFEAHQQQLFALSTAAIDHPAVNPRKPPDRVFFVTNQQLTPPVRSRVVALSTSLVAKGFAGIQSIEREELLSMFVAAHGTFFPQEPEQLSDFFRVFLDDGRGPLQKRQFAKFLTCVLPRKACSAKTAQRAFTSAAVFSAYMVAPAVQRGNHIAEAEGWLIAAFAIMGASERLNLPANGWAATLDLTWSAIESSIRRVVDEACSRSDLIEGRLTDSFVYGTRALITCAYASALFLATEAKSGDSTLRVNVRRLLLRERSYITVQGEYAVPFVFVIAAALERLGYIKESESLIVSLLDAMARANQSTNSGALPDPYHDFSELLNEQIYGRKRGFGDERYDGKSYMCSNAIEWLARRLFRRHLNDQWPRITRLQHLEVIPSTPDKYFVPEDSAAKLIIYNYPLPTSWADVRANATVLLEERIPSKLWERPEMIPFLPLVWPHRFTRDCQRLLDWFATGRVTRL